VLRTPTQKLLALLVAATLASCAAYQAQHARRPASPSGQGAPSVSSASAAPGVAPSGEFSELTADGKIARVRGEAEATREELARSGRYSCCVRPACTECLLKRGECHCAKLVREKGSNCGECMQGWIDGKGAVEGVSAWDLLQRKLYEVRGTDEPKGEAKPADPPGVHHP